MLNTEVTLRKQNPVTNPSSAKQNKIAASVRTCVASASTLNSIPKAARRGSGCSSAAELPAGPAAPSPGCAGAGKGSLSVAAPRGSEAQRWGCERHHRKAAAVTPSGTHAGRLRVSVGGSVRAGTRPLPPADGFVDADGHEDDGEQQGAEDAAQQHCEGGGRQVKRPPRRTKRSRRPPPPYRGSASAARRTAGCAPPGSGRPAPPAPSRAATSRLGSARFGSPLQHGEERCFLFLPPAPPRQRQRCAPPGPVFPPPPPKLCTTLRSPSSPRVPSIPVSPSIPLFSPLPRVSQSHRMV